METSPENLWLMFGTDYQWSDMLRSVLNVMDGHKRPQYNAYFIVAGTDKFQGKQFKWCSGENNFYADQNELFVRFRVRQSNNVVVARWFIKRGFTLT